MKKYITIIIVGIAIVLLAFLIMFVRDIVGGLVLRGSPVSEKSVISSYSKNKQLFDDIKNSLLNYSEDLDITSYKQNGSTYILSISINDNEANDEDVKDKSLNSNLSLLFKDLKYYSISKYKNGIYFMKHSGRSFEQGVVYSIDGKKPDSQSIQINTLYSIGNNWYYYMGS